MVPITVCHSPSCTQGDKPISRHSFGCTSLDEETKDLWAPQTHWKSVLGERVVHQRVVDMFKRLAPMHI